ncbi:MAG: hypothetical protein HW421_2296 [Ignavibacteria bacterium]|nr:hypothetical protein [Ignavibacteria bacterium]
MELKTKQKNNIFSATMTEKPFRKILFLFALICGVVFIILGFNAGINPYDEGLITVGAEQITNGNIPYNDFRTLYPPGQFYLFSVILSAFGNKLIIFRMASVAINLMIAFYIMLITRKVFNRSSGILPFLLASALLGGFGLYGRPSFTAVLFILIEIYYLLEFIDSRKSINLLIAGATIGVATLFRHDFGAYAFAATFLFLLSISIVNPDFRKKSAFISIIREVFYFASGFIFVLLPYVFYLFYKVPTGELYDALIAFPMQIYPEYRSLPTPLRNLIATFSINSQSKNIRLFLEAAQFLIAMHLFMISILSIAKTFIKNRIEIKNKIHWKNLVIALTSLFLFHQAIYRSDFEHIIPALLISLPLIEVFRRLLSKTKLRISFFYILVLLILIFPVTWKARDLSVFLNNNKTNYFTLPRAAGIRDAKDWVSNFNAACRLLKDSTKENEKIYIGSERHDKLVGCDVMAYYLAERLPATKYYELQPGLTTTAKIQNAIVFDLALNKVRYIMLVRQQDVTEKNKSAVSSNVFILDDYIKSNFTLFRQFGAYSIYKKNE